MDAILNPAPARRSDYSWHLLAVGVLTTVWYAVCLSRYGVTGQNAAEFSVWTRSFVAASVWGGVAGSALLLIRSRWAVQAFTVALVGLMAASANLFVFAEVPANLYAMPMILGMWVITLATLFYASRLQSHPQPLDLAPFELVE